MQQKIILEDYETLSATAAGFVIDLVKDIPDVLLCFATGNTPVGTYRHLVQKAKEQQVDFSKCSFIGLDEWVGVPGDKSGSCYFILQEQLFKPLNISAEQVHLFNGMAADLYAECSKMNSFIDANGGIDLLLAGIGLNGHIGFNEPGVPVELEAHVQQLHPGTLQSGHNYFNEPTEIKNGITLGMAQVMKARTLMVLANGTAKAAIVQQAAEGTVTNNIPASYIQQHKNALLVLDKEAAALLNI